MIVGVFSFIISWSAFYFFSHKKKFRLYVLTIYVGLILALITDLLMFVYPLWEYPGTPVEKFGIQMTNSFGLYFVVLYFFLQTLPKKQTVLSVACYIFYWSIFAIILEVLFLYIGFIKHGLWWNIGFSYAADLVLFTVFYMHHKWVLKLITKNHYS